MLKYNILLLLSLTIWGCGAPSTSIDSPATSEIVVESAADSGEPMEDYLAPEDRIMGKWASTDDPNYTIEFLDAGVFKEYTNGKLQNEGTYKYNPTCEGYADKVDKEKSAGCLDVEIGKEKYNYNLLTFTETDLSYALVGGAGKTLSFKIALR